MKRILFILIVNLSLFSLFSCDLITPIRENPADEKASNYDPVWGKELNISNIGRRVTAASETITMGTNDFDDYIDHFKVKGGQYSNWTTKNVGDTITFNMDTDESWYFLQVKAISIAGRESKTKKLPMFRGTKSKLGKMNYSYTYFGNEYYATTKIFLDADVDQHLVNFTEDWDKSITVIVPASYSPYIINNTSGSTYFAFGSETTPVAVTERLKVIIEAGVTIYVTKDYSITFGGWDEINGIQSSHVKITSNETVPAPGDYSIYFGSGNTVFDSAPFMNISYLDIEYYSRLFIQSPLTITDSTFTNFSLSHYVYIPNRYFTYDSITYYEPNNSSISYSTFTPAGAFYSISLGSAAYDYLIKTFSINYCLFNGSASTSQISINALGKLLNLTNSNLSNSSGNNLEIFDGNIDDHDVSSNYWGYNSTGGSLTDLKIVEGTGSGTLTWEPYFTTPVAGVGPR